jgi:hypothetical protein
LIGMQERRRLLRVSKEPSLFSFRTDCGVPRQHLTHYLR